MTGSDAGSASTSGDAARASEAGFDAEDRGLVASLVARLAPELPLAVAEAPRERWLDDLRPAEARYVRDAPAERRASFAAGRHLARCALRSLGAPDTDLGRVPGEGGAPARAPEWPAGFTGSLSHSDRHCAAVVARCTLVAGIGLDLEAPSRVRPALLGRICTAGERARLRAAGDEANVAALHFAAKEAFYKLWHPLAGWAPGFRDVELEAVDGQRFRIALVEAPPEHARAKALPLAGRRVFDGVWGVQGDLLAALITWPVQG
jgi:4'-phosphopantetheinyl transferase EntD